MSLGVISAEAIKTVIEFETDAAFQTRCLQNRFSAEKKKKDILLGRKSVGVEPLKLGRKSSKQQRPSPKK